MRRELVFICSFNSSLKAVAGMLYVQKCLSYFVVELMPEKPKIFTFECVLEKLALHCLFNKRCCVVS